MQLCDSEYQGTVAGSSNNHYHVKSNTEHIRKFKCDRPVPMVGVESMVNAARHDRR